MERNDLYFLSEAEKLACENVRAGGGPFGAVIVKAGKVISTGVNLVIDTYDPSAHAEIEAIRAAGQVLKNHDLSGCVLYSSCEPCPMCLGAIYWAHIDRVVYGSTRKDAGKAGFMDETLYTEIGLDPAERKIRFERIELPQTGEVFRLWMSKSDRKEY
ncbi:MAG: nucleoside deaminase [Bacteroidales bacterium]|nr:nucleoside deaminase [Bacteroidales bacterium]